VAGSASPIRCAAHEAAPEIARQHALHIRQVLHRKRTIQAQGLPDVLQVLFGHAAGALAEHDGGIAGQAHRIGNEQRHRDDHEDRLENAFDKKTDHRQDLAPLRAHFAPVQAPICLLMRVWFRY
jgi:hypothetical protein